MENQKVSIIIPVFNGEKYIKQSIDSIKQQSYKDIEIIVIDDGSSDKTATIVNQYENIITITQDRKGATAARNAGLARSTGEYIKFLDSDDYLSENIIELQVKLANKCKENEIPYGYSLNFHEGKNHKLIIKKPKIDLYGKQSIGLILDNIQTSLPLHRRSSLLKINGFNQNLTSKQEWNLHIRLSLAGHRFIYNDHPAIFQRHHNESHRISNRKKTAENEIKNLAQAYSDLISSKDDDIHDAFAYYVWETGRLFALDGDKTGAELFFSWSDEIAKNDKFRFLSYKEIILNKFYTRNLAKIVRRIKHYL